MIKTNTLPIKSVILFFIVVLSLGGLVKYLADTEHKIISRKNKEEKPEKSEKQHDNNPVFKGFLLKSQLFPFPVAPVSPGRS